MVNAIPPGYSAQRHYQIHIGDSMDGDPRAFYTEAQTFLASIARHTEPLAFEERFLKLHLINDRISNPRPQSPEWDEQYTTMLQVTIDILHRRHPTLCVYVNTIGLQGKLFTEIERITVCTKAARADDPTPRASDMFQNRTGRARQYDMSARAYGSAGGFAHYHEEEEADEDMWPHVSHYYYEDRVDY
ncbi:hypothetical protein Poli38472_005091 [Pythium oligandrum]|uniref:Uncharacterized protein n=1 Tax=Pythium oligandrum TaxID=41045 RepID=A0A8K1FLA4_PYTOL|nr:hypothetical protein Poli38472_005091 [Pythium oligandrum]|eukprot:TMW62473.1 hypothetical protein Poli38472_005091 [Pythium oligandrum]